MRRIIMLTAAATLAWQASAQTTTMQVPQGSDNYATIGQIECLEDEGSGRYCAATWECADGTSGDLWRDMENQNGRRTIVSDHPIANRRDCTVEVDGKAAAQWFHGFRPQGRDGSVVGLANAMDALRPVYKAPETTAMVGDSGGSLAAYILNKTDTTLRKIAEDHCGERETARQRRICIDQYPIPGQLVTAMTVRATPWLRCVADHFDSIREYDGHERARYLLGMIPERTGNYRCGHEGWEERILCAPDWAYLTGMHYLARFALAGESRGIDWRGDERVDGLEDCWALAEEELESHGLEVEASRHGLGEIYFPEED